ncbi:hypothetical protein Pam3_08 [Pseudanabaena phage Pam3]|nr:hypothetical protein Pam3_08 [Pseudanabaena phage Pam3]
MAKINVTNKHDAALDVAGITVRPKATVAVEERDFKTWKTGHAASIWLEQGLIVAGKTADAKAEPETNDGEGDGSGSGSGAKPDRAALLARAKELKLDLPANISNTKLAEAVAEAEKPKA